MVKVFVSEWTRRAAHNLDMKRDEWLSQKATNVFAEPELERLQVDSSVDHSAILAGSYDDIIRLNVRAIHDIGVLQAYLAKLNSTKTIGGKQYPPAVFDTYRGRVVKELQYKHILATVTKQVLRSKRMFVANGLARPEHLEAMKDWELLDQYDRVLRDKMKSTLGEGWFATLSENDQKLLSYVSQYLRRRRSSLPHDATEVFTNAK